MLELLEQFHNVNTLDIYQYFILDNKLHMYIAQCTGKHILVKLMYSLRVKTRQIRIISSKYEDGEKTGDKEKQRRLLEVRNRKFGAERLSRMTGAFLMNDQKKLYTLNILCYDKNGKIETHKFKGSQGN